MADFIIITGDKVQITIKPPAVVPMLIKPGTLVGTSKDVMVNNKPVCLQGDELPPEFKVPMPYQCPPFTTPGVGKLTLIPQKSNLTTTTSNGKPILIKGGSFKAIFTISAPATTPPSPAGTQPDPVMVKEGDAMFITTNTVVQAG